MIVGDFINMSILLGISSGSTLIQNNTTHVNQLVVVQSYTPGSSGDAYGITGQITWDENYIYVKTNSGWARSQLELF